MPEPAGGSFSRKHRSDLLYFAMSYPLSLLARRLEAKLKGEPA